MTLLTSSRERLAPALYAALTGIVLLSLALGAWAVRVQVSLGEELRRAAFSGNSQAGSRPLIFGLRQYLADPRNVERVLQLSGELGGEVLLSDVLAALTYLASLLERSLVTGFEGLSWPDDFVARAAYRVEQGQLDGAREDLEAALSKDPHHPHARYGLATVLALQAKGKPELKPAALEALGKAVAGGWRRMDWTREDPKFSALHGDPAFEALVRLSETLGGH